MDGERDLVGGTAIYRIARRATQDLHFFHKIPQTRINIRFRPDSGKNLTRKAIETNDAFAKTV